MIRFVTLAFIITALPAVAAAQSVNGGTGRDPRPIMPTNNRNTDSTFAGGLGDYRNHGTQTATTCLIRKSDGRYICHKRDEWEKIAAALAPTR